MTIVDTTDYEVPACRRCGRSYKYTLTVTSGADAGPSNIDIRCADCGTCNVGYRSGVDHPEFGPDWLVPYEDAACVFPAFDGARSGVVADD